MNAKVVGLCLALLLMASAGHAQQASDVADAEKAARQWLALTDEERYVDSWKSSAAIFQGKVTQADWSAMLANSRTPLGKLLSRVLLSATYRRELPGAPAGDYVVIQYTTQFENEATAVETVTPMKEKDGAWRVSGYFIH